MVRSQRSQSLDVLRALAIFLVFGNHMTPPEIEHAPWVHALAAGWVRGGWIGVDLFFVLSGFLVSGLLFREYALHRNILAGTFLIRRGFKIYPGFWVMLAATGLVALANHHFHPSRYVHELLFVQNYLYPAWNHTWSLAVEEHFYLGIVALMMLLAAGGRLVNPFAKLPLIFLAVAVLSLALRVVTAHGHEFEFRANLARTHLRMDSLFFGVLIGYCFAFHGDRLRDCVTRHRFMLAACGVLLLVPPFLIDRESSKLIYVYWPTCLFVGSGLILLVLVFHELPDIAAVRGLAYIGANSYAIYLWHLPVKAWVDRIQAHFAPGRWQIPWATAYMSAAVVCGIIMTWLIEGPALRLRDLLYPSRSPRPAAPVHATDAAR